MGIPLFVPGPRTTQGTSENHRVAIWRSSVVIWGTDELTAMPVTEAAMSRPSRSSSWVRRTACSSGVRVGTVERRQWCVRPGGAVGSCSVPMPTPTLSSITGTRVGVGALVEPDDGLGVADVNDQEHLQLFPSCRSPLLVGPDEVEPEVEHGRRVGERPDRDAIRPGRRVGADRVQGHPAGHLGEDGSRRVEVGQPQRPRPRWRGPCCRAARRRRRPGRPRPPGRARRTRSRPCAPATAPGPGRRRR